MLSELWERNSKYVFQWLERSNGIYCIEIRPQGVKFGYLYTFLPIKKERRLRIMGKVNMKCGA